VNAATSVPTRPSRRAAWLLAIRPQTLPVSVGPVLVGIAAGWAEGGFRPVAAAAAVLVALLLQVAANLANDLFDFRSGADTADRLGPPRAAALGLLTERELVAGTATVVALAVMGGLVLAAIGGPVILVLGVAAIVSLLAYSGGPWPYGYHGLGEVFVFIFFGVVAVAGTAYLQTDRWEPLSFATAIPMGCLITAVLVVNNLRDISTDAATGKRTLAVRIGERGTQLEFGILIAVAYVVPITLLVGRWLNVASLLPLLSAPIAIPLIRTVVAAGEPRRLNLVLRGTARLSLLFAVLFAVGIGVGGRP